ncbi:head maturation protease, ClpP-related [Oenococcus oeni]|uniref:head maturation protease, ClpP-related n=1 Tax=Oenococcus oeni TaxID=1247 RepID=UPI0010B812B0|nr:head maturation protease, ClpP-related [Oenococcus oeni]SYW19485.1 Prophage Clp protease-like protein [Oenococcus oeni]
MTKIINVKGDVVDNDTALFYSFFEMACVNPQSVQNQLQQGDPNEDVEVDIASNGGDVFAASEIYTMLQSYQGSVNVVIQGLAASAASIIAMAGKNVSISPTAQIMIHKCLVDPGFSNADDLRTAAGVSDGIDQSIANAYELKTGMSQADLLQLMSNATWMTAQQAVDNGFADEILFVQDKELSASNSISSVPNKKAINKFLNLLNKAKPKDMDMGSDGSDDNADSNLLPAINPLYPEGTPITVLADHMPNMQGAEGVVRHAYISNVYIIDYQPTDGSSEVTGHRWVTEDEIENLVPDADGQDDKSETKINKKEKENPKAQLQHALSLLF